MNLVLALASALVLGSADFVGGLAAKRAAAAVVVIWSNAAGLATALLLVTVLSRSGTGWGDMLWGGLAGLCGSVGAILLYRALAGGVMSLVAPTTAAAAAALPVVAGVLTGDRLTTLAVLGVVTALGAVLLVSLGDATPDADGGRRETLRSLGLALLAGAGFGAFFVLLSRTPGHSGPWPLVWARCASLTLLLGIAAARRTSLRLPAAAARPALLSGLLDMASSALFLVAVRGGSLAVVGLLSSLYPVSTVVLARFVLKERIRPVQHCGVALAVGSVLLFAYR
ncbi:multidrug transporter [Kitasatospora herbaricolor]|uniref:EamA family transporter n=1 Tax=Kitasatospora herbaricolor TaxID=68217 RepID=UPI00174EB254|nr:EamA family transporter [Kitasatospora herbaricolor]MDQ0309542.1 drug/metabolite transporter (DMT)-like permease [Kitasatospora herbaricolor]GGV01157.1 multidrug transporter [Kitasatospora herbaricolor]